MIEKSKADCFSITESWLTTMDRDTDILVDGYNSCRLDRDLTLAGAKSCGGGVVTYIADNVTFVEQKALNIVNIDIIYLYVAILCV